MLRRHVKASRLRARGIAGTEVENAPQPGTPLKQPNNSTAAATPATELDVDVAAEYEALPPVTPSKPRASTTLATPTSSGVAVEASAAETPYYTPQNKPATSSGAGSRPLPTEPKLQRLGGAPMPQPLSAQAVGDAESARPMLSIIILMDSPGYTHTQG